MKIQKILCISIVASLFAASLPLNVFAEERTIKLESQDMRYRYYRIDTDNQVRLLRQFSEAPCRKDYSWGYDSRGVWVDKGCRAEFLVGKDNTARNAAIAAGVIGGAVLAGILISKSRNKKDKEDFDKWSLEEQEAYELGYRYGVDDRRRNRSSDYKRYRDDYNARTEDPFKRGYREGYENGYKDRDYPYNTNPNNTYRVPSWAVGTFKGYNPKQNLDVEITIRENGDVTGRDRKYGNYRGKYRNDQIEWENGGIYIVERAGNGIRVTDSRYNGNEYNMRRTN